MLPFGSLPANQSLKISTPTRPQIASEKITTTSITKKKRDKHKKLATTTKDEKIKLEYTKGQRQQRKRQSRRPEQAADSGNKQNAHAPPSGNPVPHLLVCVCVCVCPIYGHQTVAKPSPLNPLDFFFLLLFSCAAIHLRACKIRDAPTNLVGEGGGMFWALLELLKQQPPPPPPKYTRPFYTSLRCSTAYRLTH